MAGLRSYQGSALGRIAKSLALLSYVDDETHRRQILVQLNRHEKRHELARKIFHGQRGEVRKHYREGQEDQLGTLGLMVNAVCLFNSLYLDESVRRLREQGEEVAEANLARVSPLMREHVRVLGRYYFVAYNPARLLLTLRLAACQLDVEHRQRLEDVQTECDRPPDAVPVTMKVRG